jgi:hypothetical protein
MLVPTMWSWLACCDLDLTGEGYFLVILLAEFWGGKGTLPMRVKNVTLTHKTESGRGTFVFTKP